jgi:hypothetical protein
MRNALLVLMVLVVYALHQDFWNWTNKSLVFGFIPVGLAYHAAYAGLASCLMWVLVRTAWPSELEHVEARRATDERSEAGA